MKNVELNPNTTVIYLPKKLSIQQNSRPQFHARTFEQLME